MQELARPRTRVALERKVINVDGHRVGIATAGAGVPLVLLHGFGVESMLYAQPLARLTHLGFRVVAIDVPGHGRSDGIGPYPDMAAYARRIDRTLRKLRLGKTVLVGHSMGGRLAAELAASRPERCLAVVLLAPITGAPWDQLRRVLRWSPPALLGYGALAAADVLATIPLRSDFPQSWKLSRRIVPSVQSMVTRPWNALVTGSAILRAPSSTDVLDAVCDAGVPSFVVHGDRDHLVLLNTARSTARRLGATFVRVADAGHSWMVRDPETFPAIMAALLDGELGAVLAAHGIVRRESGTPPRAPSKLTFQIEHPAERRERDEA